MSGLNQTCAAMKTLTLQRLIDLGACADQRELFRETFGDSVDATPELCVSVADKFDWYWAAVHLLSEAARAEYRRVAVAARAEYDRVTTSARAEYRRVAAAARAEYDRVTTSARAEYDRVAASARAEYDRVTTSARAEYMRVEARAFGELYDKGSLT